MKTRLLLLGALAAVLVVLPAAARGAHARATSGTQTYPDSTGEDAQAPDITSMVVSNDDARNLTFKINISNRPQLTADMLILCWFDTDQKSATGDTNATEGIPGGDYAIQLQPGDVELFQWNGTDYVSGPSQTTLTYSYDATGATIHINASELGATKGFKFACAAVSGIATDAQGNPDFTNSHEDTIPDPGHGTLQYTVQAQLKLAQTAFTTTPSAAKAGKRFTASLGATENDTNGPVKSATVSCVAHVGTKGVPATHSFANGIASCFWALPKTAKGKTLRGTVTITVQGVKLTKSFAVKVH